MAAKYRLDLASEVAKHTHPEVQLAFVEPSVVVASAAALVAVAFVASEASEEAFVAASAAASAVAFVAVEPSSERIQLENSYVEPAQQAPHSS